MRALTILVLSTGDHYILETSDRPDLEYSHKITGNTGTTYGWWVPTSGRAVRVPVFGWRDRRGVNGAFSTRAHTSEPIATLVRGWSVDPETAPRVLTPIERAHAAARGIGPRAL